MESDLDQLRQYRSELRKLVSKPFDPVSLKNFVRDRKDWMGAPEIAERILSKEDSDPLLKETYDLIRREALGT